MSIAKMQFRTAGLMLLGATLIVAPAFAQQDAPPPPDQNMQHGHGGHASPEKRLEMMTQELTLTADQQTAIKQVWADQHAKMKARHDEIQAMSQDDRKAAMKAAREDENAKIEAILTPDQKTKYEAMQAKMRERREHHGGDNPPPPPAQ